jgi:predicted dehydrogenase
VLSVGIVGFGRIGAAHAEWLSAAKNIRAIAAADATPARRELAEKLGLKTFDGIEKMLAEANVDAVLIASPTAMHSDHAAAALAAAKHVMIEKPMALDLAQSKQLVDHARRANRVLSVFQNRRWDMDFLSVKHAIDNNIFGKVINVESRIGQWESCVGPAAPEWRPNWRNEASFGGGGLYDWGSHFLDQLWRLLWPAKPLRHFAELRGNIWTKDCDDFARVCIDFDSGAVGMVEINTTTTRPLPRWHIDGTSGSADSPHSLNFDLQTWAMLQFTTPGDPPRTQPLPIATPELDESGIWQEFAAACRGKGAPAVSAESVLPKMMLLDAARESSRTGMVVAIDTNDWKL